MLKRPLLILSMIILIALLSYLDLLAFQYFWYWRLWWFDIVMHALGGVVLGLAGLWLYAVSNKAELRSLGASRILLIALTASLLFGVVWEFFGFGVERFYMSEVAFKSFAALRVGFADSLGDILSDAAGALLAALSVIVILRWKKNKLR